MIVGIGASAGGLEALKTLLPTLPSDSGFVFVIVVHLQVSQPSLLAEILLPFSSMPVSQVAEDLEVEPNHVYVIPPGYNLSTIDSHLRLSKIEERREERAPIDHFFETLAKAQGDRCVGVILSGTGADGSFGLRKIKEHGGLTIAQDPKESQFDSMPRNAIATGLVDFVLPLEDMQWRMVRFATTRPRIEIAEPPEGAPARDHQLLQSVLAEVRTRTNLDFSKYKRSTVLRRIRRRMQLNQKELLEDYLDFLRGDATEAQLLAEEFLITVTRFFRDAEVYDYLEKEIVPRLFEGKTSLETIRVWSVGCATGEEAYSVAMLMLEQAGRVTAAPKIEIFASDLHEPSLRRAREGEYADSIEAEVSPERLERFFVREDTNYRIRKDVREIVVFANHNLLRDPPFSRLDLIICRNLLIYLQRELQNDVIDLFHYALNPEGLLLLGPSESIDRTALFQPKSKQHGVFVRRNVPAPEPRLPVFPQTLGRLGRFDAPSLRLEPTLSYGALHQKMVERYAPPSLLVDQDFRIVHASEHVGRYLQVPGGELSASVFRLAREELRVELRAALHAAARNGESIHSRPVAIELDGKPTQVVVHVRPSKDAELGSLHLVIFDEYEAFDSAPSVPLGPEAAEARAELDATRERLRAVIEQYETSQEEMRAGNEELQSINEELRSTMEELETSKEELQSMNEELQTVNQENRHKVEELSQLTGDLQNLMAATEIATLFLDRELRILRVTPRARDLFNVRASDSGRPITELRHRVGYGQLQEDALAVLGRFVPIQREIQSESGEWYLTRIVPYRSSSDQIQGVVITLVEITQLKDAELTARNSEEKFRALVAASAQAVWSTDAEGKVVEDSPSWREFTGQAPEQMRGMGWVDAVHPDDRDQVSTSWQNCISTQTPLNAEFRLRYASGGWRFVHSRVVPLRDGAGKLRGWVGMSADVTDRRAKELAQQEAEVLRRASQRKDEFLAILGHELRNPLAPLRNTMVLFAKLLPDHSELRRIREIAERQVLHLTRLVDELLDVAKISSGQMELTKKRVELRDIVDAAIANVDFTIKEHRHELEVEQSCATLEVEGDDVRLVQIFSNLLDNAAKYTHENGRIRVSLSRDGHDGLVSIKDNGIGLSPESLTRIFDVFSRVEPSGRNHIAGLGLGLTLVRRLAELHGGAVKARSDGLGKGAEFLVTLPLAESAGVVMAVDESPDLPTAGRTILLVDDYRDVLDSMKMLLEMEGHSVAIACDGRSALESAAEHAPDIVLLDVGLPDMDGYELARRLRRLEATSKSLLVATTGFGQSKDYERSAEAGIDYHLVKPIDLDSLRQIIRKSPLLSIGGSK
ncbi:chemotaxis protein CheB [Methylosinus sp. Ce-a6]|uniref:chemotaxis protein CheB n=1 Tax=Methylosinus sp. Ce-a6 TaxID=2172005 RepID=UPI00135B3C94|nr:chemotaxis protein CheB [Methylosinus sp. Ce-a6]